MGQLLKKAFPEPVATVKDVMVKRANLSSIHFIAKVSVYNPYFFSIPIFDITSTITSAAREIARVNIPDKRLLKRRGETDLDVEVEIPYSILFSLGLDVVADGDIDYQLHLLLTLHFPIVGNITIPVSRKGQIKLLPL